MTRLAITLVGDLLLLFLFWSCLFLVGSCRFYFSFGVFFNIYGRSPILVQLLSVSSTVVPLFIKLHVDVLQFALFNILIYFARLFNICITSLWWCGAMVHFQCQRELPLQKFGYTIHAFTIKIVLLLNTP